MEKNRVIPTTFDVFYDDQTEQIDPLITRARVRIFYKYENRNRGYITDEFAAKLEQKIAWTPIVGIYNLNEKDFSSHQHDKNIAPMYGLVPPDHNGAWEEHLDPDGVTRTYFAVDVYLYTGRYDVAKQIIGNPQSLEFNKDTIQGSWQNTSLGEYYFYDDADFIGLCVLGKAVEPAFEGAAFFEILKMLGHNDTLEGLDMATLVEALTSFAKAADANPEKKNNEGGQQSMEIKDFKFSTDSKVNALWSAANTGDSITHTVTSVDDEAVVIYSIADNTFNRVSYVSDGDTFKLNEESVEFALVEKAKLTDYEQTATELETAKTAIIEMEEKLAESDAKIVELEEAKSTFEVEASNTKKELEEVQGKYSVLQGEKNAEIKAAKTELLGEYEGRVSADFAKEIAGKLDDYSFDDLEKELLFAWKKEQPSDFSKKDEEQKKAPKSFEKEKEGGITAILDEYKNKS